MSTKDICNDDTLSEAEKWKKIYGTEYVGNLPQYKKIYHVGYIWAPCPYSTQSSDQRTRALLGLNYGDPVPEKTDHTDGEGAVHYLTRNGKSFECVFENCPYNIDNGKHYFYT